MEKVRGDSIIQIQKGNLKTCILEQDFETLYKPEGWTVVKKDWTQERAIKPRVDATEHLALAKMAEGAFKKK
jgi:hypothetical protein